MLRVLAERRFPSRTVKVLARSARTLTVDGREYQVEPTTPEAFDGIDIALFAGTEGERGAAVVFGPEAVQRGAVIIDNGSAWQAGVHWCEANGIGRKEIKIRQLLYRES